MNKSLFSSPTLERKHPIVKEGGSGIQKIYRFTNGYGASVVQFKVGEIMGSYTDNEKEWELAVIKFHGEGIEDSSIDYSTGITDDVLGHLKEAEVEEILGRIKELKKMVKKVGWIGKIPKVRKKHEVQNE